MGNGAVILTNPDKPVNFVEVTSQKSGTEIGMAWDEGAANGGSVVVDYRVSYDQGTGTESYTILASELL